MRILLVEDDRDAALSLKEDLKRHYIVELAHNGEEGEYKAHVNNYDAILLDYILPDIHGDEVCKRIRKSGIMTPILMLTGQGEIDSKVTALDAGADDYLTKPYNIKELMARLRALLRRHSAQSTSTILKVGDLQLDLKKKLVKRKGTEIRLRRKEFYLLEFLMRNTGIVVTRDMILDHAWDSSSDLFTNTIDVHINSLREKIDKPYDKKLIKTIHGTGYKMEA